MNLAQYNHAVMKDHMTEAQIAGRTLLQAQKLYYMSNRTYATKVEDLLPSLNWPVNSSGTARNGEHFDVAIQGNEHFWVNRGGAVSDDSCTLIWY